MYFCMAFIIHCTVGFWLGFFSPSFQTLPLIAESQSELQGREGNVLFCRSEFAFVGEKSSAERNKNEAFSAALKMPSPKNYSSLPIIGL